MSLDLFERETEERLERMTPLERPEPGAWHGFARGSASIAMQGFAKAARAIDLAGAIFPIAQDLITSGTEVQDRYFREHEEVFQRAVDYWTPRPDEVGVAGQIAGSLLSFLPLVITSPSLAVATTQLSMGEDLVKKGVDPVKAEAAAAAYATGLGLGIWVPILGRTITQRMLLGGAGFNVLQGATMRGLAGEILEGTPAAGEFRALSPEEMTLDALLGLAFGAIAHFSPAMRAQGEEFRNRFEAWRANLKPEEVAALTTLRMAQHASVDTLPGKPTTPADLEAHVARVRAAVEQLVKGERVFVDDLPAPRTLEPDTARVQESVARTAELVEAAEAMRVDEGLPPPPDLELPRAAAAERPTAMTEAELSGYAEDPLQAQALRVAQENPDLRIRIGEDEQGMPVHQTLAEHLEAARRLSARALEDAKLFEIAAACLA